MLTDVLDIFDNVVTISGYVLGLKFEMKHEHVSRNPSFVTAMDVQLVYHIYKRLSKYSQLSYPIK